MLKLTNIFPVILYFLINSAVQANDIPQDDGNGIGGPTEVVAQIKDNDQDKLPAFRFPALDQNLTTIKDWKNKVHEDYGLRFGFDYTLLTQGLSATLPSAEHDKATSGVARFYGQWTLFNRGQKSAGSLVFKVDHRHGYGDISNNTLGGEAGYLSQTGMLFSDAGLLLVDFNWQQYFNNGQSVFMVGRFDPNDYHDVLGYANPWTAFSNLDSLINMSIALPDVSMGLAAGHWFENSTYVWGSINDANGTVDSLDIFENGFSELYKSVEFGYSPSRQERYFKNIHVMLWQMDERSAYGKNNTSSDGSEGIVVGANYTWDDEWMVFGKLGLSTVDSISVAQLYEQQTTIGFIKYFREHSDLFGLSLSYGQIPDEFGTPNPSQTTIESFYRFQLAKNLAITPNIQYLIDPALNTQDDILVLGVRLRFTL